VGGEKGKRELSANLSPRKREKVIVHKTQKRGGEKKGEVPKPVISHFVQEREEKRGKNISAAVRKREKGSISSILTSPGRERNRKKKGKENIRDLVWERKGEKRREPAFLAQTLEKKKREKKGGERSFIRIKGGRVEMSL